MSPQQQAAQEAAEFVKKFNDIILYPTIALLSAVAFFVFLWGVSEYFFNANNDQARQQGVKHITYGIIGLVVMLSAFTILSIAAATFGLNEQLDCANNPSGGGCAGAFQIPSQNGGGPGGSTGNGGQGGQTGNGGPGN